MHCLHHGCRVNQVHQQDSVWSWIVLATATFNDALTNMMTYCYSVILPVLVKEFNQTREKAAWIPSIAHSLFYLAAPLSALVSMYLGNRWTAVIGSIMCIAGLVGSSFSPSLELMYLTQGVLFGLGASLLHLPGILTIQKCFKKRRALATGIFATSSSFSAMLGPLFQLLIDKLGWRKMFWIFGVWFLVPLAMEVVLYSANFDDGAESDERRSNTNWRCSISCSFWNSWYTLRVIVIGLQSFVLYMPLSHVGKHAEEVGYPDNKSSLLLVYIGIASLIGKVTAGRILDSPRSCAFWMNQFSGFILAISILLLKFSKDDKMFIPFAILYGIGNGSFMTSQYQIWLMSVAPESRRSGLAMGEAIAAVGIMTGSPFIGFLADQYGSYSISFVVSTAIMFAATVFLFIRFSVKKKTFEKKNEECVALGSFNHRELLEKETVL